MKTYEAIGVIEVKHFTNALKILDSICKGCEIELLNTENKLGGRLVSIIIGGNISNVQSSIDIAEECVIDGSIKNAVCIRRPHEQIMKFIVPQKKTKRKQTKKSEEIKIDKQNEEELENNKKEKNN